MMLCVAKLVSFATNSIGYFLSAYLRTNVHTTLLTETIDTTTSGGRLIFHIFAGLAEFERSIIRERTKAGLESAKARGRLGGRPPAMQEKDIAVAKAMLSDPNITVEQVAEQLGVAPSTLYRHIPGGRSVLSN